MRKSSISVAALSGLFVLCSASPASAHAVFVGAPSGYPTNTEQSLTISVPHERDDVTYNVDVVVAMPMGWTALSCQGKATWTCSLGTTDGRQVVHFTKNSGAEVAEDETFQFTVRTASTVATFAFPTVQTYNTGEIVRWIGAAGTGNPAPTLATLPGGTAPQPTPSTTNPDASPTTTTVVTPPPTSGATTNTTSTTAATTTTAGTGTTTTTAGTTTTSTITPTTATIAPSTTATANDDDDGGSGTLLAGLIAVLLLAVTGGGLFAYRRQRASTSRHSP
jgi:hypothetical protein